MYRLKKYKQGWIVEYQRVYFTLFFITFQKWKYITHYAGMPEKPFYYRTPEAARDGALSDIRDEINLSFLFRNI
jgi:hypothetical protein